MQACISLTVFTVVACGFAFGLLWTMKQTDVFRPALFTALVCFLASLVSLVPAWLISLRDPALVPQAFGLGTIVRLAICGGTFILAHFYTDMSMKAVTGWLMGWYLSFLIIEVIILKLYISKLPTEVFALSSAGENQA